MTRMDRVLNTLHRFAERVEYITRPRKRWTRERLTSVLDVGTSIVSAVAVAFPQIRGFVVAAGLMGALKKDEEPAPQITAPKKASALQDED